MTTTYRDWQVGDKINICASIDEFCEPTLIFANDINVTKSPDICTVEYGTERGCGLHLNNVTLTFKLVKSPGSVEDASCSPQIVYKTIGSATTNSNGVCGIIYDVTNQDRLDYESQITNDIYKVMVCITNSDGQPTTNSELSTTTNTITILSSHLECVNNICTRVTGAGTNTCTTEGSTTECSHLECVNNICTRVTGTGVDTCTTEYAVCTTSYLKTIEAYFKVSKLFPESFINASLNSIYYFAFNTLLKSTTDYYVKDISFNSNTYIITLTIEITTPPQSSSQLSNSNNKIVTLIAPIVYLAIIALLTLINAFISLYAQFTGTKETIINAPPPGPRNITLNFLFCSVDTDGNEHCLTDIVTDVPDVTATYVIDGVTQTKTSTKHAPITITIDSNKSTTVSFKSEGYTFSGSVYEIPIGGDIIDVIKLIASAFSPPPPPVTITGCSVIGKYEYSYTDNMEVIKYGTYDVSKNIQPNLINSEGKDYKLTSGRKYCIKIYPNEKECSIPTPACWDAIAGVTPDSITIITYKCSDVLNKLNIHAGYKNQNGFMEFLLPKDITEVTITPSTGIERVDIENEIFYVLGKLENGTEYNVNIEINNYTVLDNNQKVTFDTDFTLLCPGTETLTFETQAPPSTYDVTFNIKNKTTNLPIKDATITSSDGITKYCTSGNSGMCLVNALAPRTYSLIIKHPLYKEQTLELVVNSTLTKEILLDVKDQSGTFGKIDSVTHKIERTSVPMDDDEIIINVTYTNNTSTAKDYKVKLLDEAGIEVESTSCTNLIVNGSQTTIFDSNWKLWSFKTIGKKYSITLYVCEPDNVIRYADSKIINFTTIELNPCCINLPLIGCISQSTCNTIKWTGIGIGALYVGYTILKTTSKK